MPGPQSFRWPVTCVAAHRTPAPPPLRRRLDAGTDVESRSACWRVSSRSSHPRPTSPHNRGSDDSFPVPSSASNSIGFATTPAPERQWSRSPRRLPANPGPAPNLNRPRSPRRSTESSCAATVTGWRGSTASRPEQAPKLRREYAWRRTSCGEAGSAFGCLPAERAPSSNRDSRSTRTGGCATGTSVERPRRGHLAMSQRIRLARTRALPPRLDGCSRTHDRFPRIACRNSYGRRRPCSPRPASERRARGIPATNSQWQPARRNENQQGDNGYCRTPAMR